METFEQLAIEHASAIQEGDNIQADQINNQLIGLKDTLLKEGNLKGLAQFLNHENESVRHFAAVFLLPIDEEKALNTLKDLTQSESIISLDAEMTIDMWKKGMLA